LQRLSLAVTILGEADDDFKGFHRMTITSGHAYETRYWRNGPSRVSMSFDNGKVCEKEVHFATAWETLTWYAKKGAAKIGLKWD
jgi:hypothetical protein